MKNSAFLLALLLLVFSHNINSQWVHTSTGMYNFQVYSLAASQTHIFAGTPEALSVSTNNGASWFLNSFNAQLEPVHSIYINGITVFCGVQDYGVTVSANNGSGWTSHHPLGSRIIYSLTYTTDGKLFAGASASMGGAIAGVHLSNDNGYSFNITSLTNKTVLSLTSTGNTIFAGTLNEGVYLTTNNGSNWSQTSLNNHTIKSLASNGGFIFAGTSAGGVYISSNNGNSWVQSSLNNQEIHSIAVNGNSVFAGSSANSNFYVSTNNGASWILKNEGIISYTIHAICIKDNFIFAGTSNNGVYRRQLSDLIGIQPVSNEIPNQYSLSQNYPNPFNPVTKIRFSIPLSRGVSEGRGVLLIVYDALGREVSTLVNEELNPGTYEVDWNASNYPSGVYFYKLAAGSFSETKKMIIIK